MILCMVFHPMPSFTFIVGTRPEIIKAVPLIEYVSNRGYSYNLIFSGQHFIGSMSRAIFEEYGVQPNIVIEGGDHVERVARLVEYVRRLRDTIMVVIGDTSTALFSTIGYIHNTNDVILVHIESGLHSLNPLSTEERIRTIVEENADIRIAPSELELEILKRRGIRRRAYPFGNPIFNLLEKRSIIPSDDNYVLVTFHRRTNVESETTLTNFVNILRYLSKLSEVKFVTHPTTVDFLRRYNLLERVKSIDHLEIVEPLRHGEFLKLLAKCSFVVTDSEGVQEEALFYRKIAVVLRPSTPRWVAILNKLHFLANPADQEHVIDVINYVVDHKDEIEKRLRAFNNPYHKPTCVMDVVETSANSFEEVIREKRRFDLSKLDFGRMSLDEFLDMFASERDMRV